MTCLKFLMLGVLFISTLSPALADDNVLHIYSSRHYSTDEALYDNFTNETGIKIERIDGKGDALIARLQQEDDSTPADLLITVDSGRLWRAQEAGLFAKTDSKILNNRIPVNLRDADGRWFGLSKRARVIVYNKDKVDAGIIQNYEDLTKDELKGRVCIRTSSNIYNLSLMASMISMNGIDNAKAWATGLQGNLARKPQGGDTDQIKAVAAGICDVAVVNSYYYYRLMKSDNADDKNVVADLGIIYPNQSTSGTHINISGAGVLKNADNKAAAVQFLEYLTSDSAQKYFADGNNEYPVVQGIDGYDITFKEQNINVSEFGKHQRESMMIFDLIKFP